MQKNSSIQSLNINTKVKTQDFFAKDIYPKWYKYVTLAQKSITVISPYVDNTVKMLLTNSKINYGVKICIITRIDPDTIFDKPYQIRSLINCMKNDIAVFHLDELHAKLLIIDDKYISVGSQNFTSRGKKNKETTMISKHSFEDSKFLEQINEWKIISDEIELDYLSELEKGLKKFRPKIIKFRALHKTEFEKLSDTFNKRKKIALLRELEKQRQNSALRFAAENVFLSMTTVESNYNYITTLLADSHCNLQHWKDKNEVDSINSLTRLKYYPMINIENSALAFGRLASTRISSFLKEFHFPFEEIKGNYIKIGVKCPKKNTSKINIEFKFDLYDEEWNIINAKLSYYFDGSSCKRIKEVYDNTEIESIIRKLFLKNKKLEKRFLKQYFRGADLATIGLPIDEFLEGSRYKLYIIQYLTNPILVCEKQW